MSKEQSVIIKIIKVFCGKEKILLQHLVLRYRLHLQFPEYKLAIEIDEKVHKDRNLKCEIEKKKAIEKGLGCKFIRINLYGQDFDIFVKICKIYNDINESTKNH